MVKEIPLQNGMVALVDDEDYERCMKFNWIFHRNGKNTLNIHARLTKLTRTNSKTIKLSRFLMGLQFGDKRIVQHKNGERLDFRKENLVVKTRKEMSKVAHKSSNEDEPGDSLIYKPRRKPRVGTSEYRGVSKDEYNHFISKIFLDGKENYLGYFDTELEAAKAYDAKAKELLGDKAILNFP